MEKFNSRILRDGIRPLSVQLLFPIDTQPRSVCAVRLFDSPTYLWKDAARLL